MSDFSVCPVLIRLWGYPVSAIPATEALAFLLGWVLLAALDRRWDLRLGLARVTLLVMYAALLGKIGAYLYYPANLLITRAAGGHVGLTTLLRASSDNTATYGAIAGVALVAAVAAWRWKVSVWRLLDALGYVAAAIAPLVYLGGLLEGCGSGMLVHPGILTLRFPRGYHPLSSPTLAELLAGRRWGEYRAMFEGALSHYPLQIHLLAGLLLIAAILCRPGGRLRGTPGTSAGLGMMLYGLLRLSSEPFRHNPPYLTRHLNLAAVLSVLFVVAGAIILLTRSDRADGDSGGATCGQGRADLPAGGKLSRDDAAAA